MKKLPKILVPILMVLLIIRAKCLRSNNPTNVVKETIEGLKSLRTAEEVAKTRSISVEQVKG